MVPELVMADPLSVVEPPAGLPLTESMICQSPEPTRYSSVAVSIAPPEDSMVLVPDTVTDTLTAEPPVAIPVNARVAA